MIKISIYQAHVEALKDTGEPKNILVMAKVLPRTKILQIHVGHKNAHYCIKPDPALVTFEESLLVIHNRFI